MTTLSREEILVDMGIAPTDSPTNLHESSNKEANEGSKGSKGDGRLVSEEELIADLSSLGSLSKKGKKTFYTKQYPLFTSPLGIVYLQGVHPSIFNAPTNRDMLKEAIKVSSFRPFTRAANSPAKLSLITQLREGRKELYFNSSFHASLIESHLALGLSLEPSKVSDPRAIVKVLSDYRLDLKLECTRKEVASPEQLLQLTSATSKREKLLSLSAFDLEDSLAQLD